eukprot:4870934-Prymnesium_polylepis.1
MAQSPMLRPSPSIVGVRPLAPTLCLCVRDVASTGHLVTTLCIPRDGSQLHAPGEAEHSRFRSHGDDRMGPCSHGARPGRGVRSAHGDSAEVAHSGRGWAGRGAQAPIEALSDPLSTRNARPRRTGVRRSPINWPYAFYEQSQCMR